MRFGKAGRFRRPFDGLFLLFRLRICGFAIYGLKIAGGAIPDQAALGLRRAHFDPYWLFDSYAFLLW